MTTPGTPAAPVSQITPTTAEHERLADRESWDLWGPHLAQRAWGTAREDYSADGDHGAGLGASHQTGWTGLVADLIIRARG
jgi:hypothetical protein